MSEKWNGKQRILQLLSFRPMGMFDFYKIAVWILTLLAFAAVGGALFQFLSSDILRLQVSWANETLHISSAKDGPWVVTHLSHLRKDRSLYSSVAQLPAPVTIIDSRGAYFTLAALQSLPWVDQAGSQVEAPKPGDPISAFYVVPQQARYRDQTDKDR